MFLFLGAALSSLLNTIVFTPTHTHRQTQIERQADTDKLENKKYWQLEVEKKQTY